MLPLAKYMIETLIRKVRVKTFSHKHTTQYCPVYVSEKHSLLTLSVLYVILILIHPIMISH